MLPRPPVAPGLPVIGHTLQLLQNSVGGAPFDYLALRWRREAGPVYTFQIPGGLPVAVISEPDAVREVTTRQHACMLPGWLLCCSTALKQRFG